MKLYVAEKVGMFSQGIVFISEDFEKTKEAARIEILKEEDDYHDFEVTMIESDSYCSKEKKLIGAWERADEYKIVIRNGRKFRYTDKKTGEGVILNSEIKWTENEEEENE